ncbi:MAG TPA: recombination mediator RecR [Candidatus Paceibacterota bacterium]|nr:recombination protein RecR [Verrucomicrobiota bacterium]HOX01913.1 recombination mediator RecR [Verrucomicrobiota bacterium]HRZ44613.1 recombination mediator RecR [Candidatus Paceibacterota bacterium]HRZ92271.1 recombination mediator RecR [Candidatus Paceibacterota bacterium]
MDRYRISTWPPPLLDLINELGMLPGIGPRSAERLALFLAQSPAADVERLAESIRTARRGIQSCATCGALSDRQPCSLCQDPRRDLGILCVVEQPVDVLNIEKTAAFRGRYHVLGGRISPTRGVGPEDLRIPELERRLQDQPNLELIVALGSDVEGDATAIYLARRLAGRCARITRLAHGLPVGSSLEFADELTLRQAIENRRPLQ